MSALDQLGRDRKLQMVWEGVPFSHAAQEILDHQDLFATKYEQDFRQNFKESPFKDSPTIVCRMSFDDIEMEGDTPTEEELVRHLKDKGLTNLEAYDTPIYLDLPNVYGAVMWLASMLKAERIGRVMIARLNAGGHVLPHKDYGPYHDYYDRLHICVGGKGCHFRCGRELVKMLPGEVWWFHNNDEHEVWNDSDTPRDHIIVDLKLRGDKHVLRTGGDSGELPQIGGRGDGGDSDGTLEGVSPEHGQGATEPPA